MLQIGATIRRVSDSKLRKKDQNTQGIPAGLAAGAFGLLEEVPFLREMGEVSKVYNPNERGAFVGELAKSAVVPQAVLWAASRGDKNVHGDTARRNPQTILQHIETGIPGLRQRVPLKKGEQLAPSAPSTPAASAGGMWE